PASTPPRAPRDRPRPPGVGHPLPLVRSTPRPTLHHPHRTPTHHPQPRRTTKRPHRKATHLMPIPDAPIATIAAAPAHHRLTTPPAQRAPRGAPERAAQYHTSSGRERHDPRTPPHTPTRAACPHSTVHHLTTTQGRLRRHGPPGNPCPGSGTPVITTARP